MIPGQYIAPPGLQGIIQNISAVDVNLPESLNEADTPYPPTPLQSLIFYIGDPIYMKRQNEESFDLQPSIVLVGPQYSSVTIRVKLRLKAVRVDFYPGGLYRMLGIPMNSLFDKSFDATEIFGNDIGHLNERLMNTSSQEVCIKLVEEFMMGRIANLKEITPFHISIYSLLQTDGAQSIEKTANQACLSLRQFERKCREQLGMSPKMFARIIRFSKAYRLHESNPKLSWTSIAYEAGYFDQMHLIRDFRDFSGLNPSGLRHYLEQTPLRMQKDLII